jgi:hypothetical protein
MTKILTGVLSVIAAGVLLIAYGLLVPRATSFERQFDARAAGIGIARPDYTSEQVMWRERPYTTGADGRPMMPGYAVPVSTASAAAPYLVPVAQDVVSLRQEPEVRALRSQTVRRVPDKPRRNWKKTALIIGGSSATGAGVGAIFGGKRGALIGAAVGGGASTIYETVKDR